MLLRKQAACSCMFSQYISIYSTSGISIGRSVTMVKERVWGKTKKYIFETLF